MFSALPIPVIRATRLNRRETFFFDFERSAPEEKSNWRCRRKTKDFTLSATGKANRSITQQMRIRCDENRIRQENIWSEKEKSMNFSWDKKRSVHEWIISSSAVSVSMSRSSLSSIGVTIKANCGVWFTQSAWILNETNSRENDASKIKKFFLITWSKSRREHA